MKYKIFMFFFKFFRINFIFCNFIHVYDNLIPNMINKTEENLVIYIFWEIIFNLTI